MELPKNLEIKNTKNGKGLFIKLDLLKEEIIFYFKGKKGDDSKTNAESLEIDDGVYLESTVEYDNYLNHSCNPNCYIDFSDLSLRALRDIKIGEEITFNYNTSEWDLVNSATPSSFICNCNSKNCVHVIKGFRYLTKKQKNDIFRLLSPSIIKRYKSAIF